MPLSHTECVRSSEFSRSVQASRWSPQSGSCQLVEARIRGPIRIDSARRIVTFQHLHPSPTTLSSKTGKPDHFVEAILN
jgi:hypothetical protein